MNASKKGPVLFIFVIPLLLLVLYQFVVQRKSVIAPKPEVSQMADDSQSTDEGLSSVVNANNQFAFDIYSKLQNDNKSNNVFLSPYSISSAFAMVQEGARNNTADEISKVFYFPSDLNARRSAYATLHNRFNRENSKYTLSVANALWAQQDYKFLDEYINALKQYYSAEAINLDFVRAADESRVVINTWVEDKTKDKIKDLFPEGSIDNSTVLVLTNAVYFKGTWIKQFNPEDTSDRDFYIDENTTVKVPMMRRTDDESIYKYMEDEDLQVLQMPYEGDNLSMLVLLPKNKDLAKVEGLLNIENLNQWKNNLSEQRVDVYFPKFTFDTKYFLKDILMQIGVVDAFTGSADFSGMDGTKSLYIQTAIHQAFVDVNEEGTEAAAATGVAVGTKAVIDIPQIPVFRADRPFLFIIQDNESGDIIFLGKVMNPI